MKKSEISSQSSLPVKVLKDDGLQYEIVLPDADKDHIQRMIFETGKPYELDMLRNMRSRIAEGDLVLDIGANVGNHATPKPQNPAIISIYLILKNEPGKALLTQHLRHSWREAGQTVWIAGGTQALKCWIEHDRRQHADDRSWREKNRRRQDELVCFRRAGEPAQPA